MNPYELMTEEQWWLRTGWAERRAEKDLQAAINLKNLAMWCAFTLSDGGK